MIGTAAAPRVENIFFFSGTDIFQFLKCGPAGLLLLTKAIIYKYTPLSLATEPRFTVETSPSSPALVLSPEKRVKIQTDKTLLPK